MEIHGIMVQDGVTKDVFREMDGFLVLMSVLSTIQPTHSWSVAAAGDMIVHEVLEAVRLVFAIVSEAMDDHQRNAVFFEVRTRSNRVITPSQTIFISHPTYNSVQSATSRSRSR